MKRTVIVALAGLGSLAGCTAADSPTAHLGTAAALSEGLVSTIAFTSTRHDPTADPFVAAEIYLIDGDGGNPRRLTDNAYADAFASLSPDGARIVFDSNRLRDETEPRNTSDLFLMNADGSSQMWLLRGSSGTWSRNGDRIAFHASASGTALPIKPDPSAATFDSDIFVLDLDACLAHGADCRSLATNITNDPAAVDDDPDWSPDGNKIVFTSHSVDDNHNNSVTAEIYMLNLRAGRRIRLTDNGEEERAPNWSPDGSRIVYMCRIGGPDFEICVMDMESDEVRQLTSNSMPDLTPSWSPDGTRIVFHRPVAGRSQLFVMNADGSGVTRLTDTPGMNLLANWGLLRLTSGEQ
jgi:TolB protein